MLQLHDVSFSYGDFKALRSVNIRIGSNQIVSIVGSNGAGKTTLINTISGVHSSSDGTIALLGKQIQKSLPYQIVEMGIVQVPEGRLLFPYMSVLENLELGAFNKNTRKHLNKSLEKVFGFFPKLKDRRNQLAGTLSGGEQQMVAIGRGLMAKPKLLMLDEPSLGLSPLIVHEVFETIKKIHEEGISVLLIEQNILQCLKISDRAYVLENGTIVMDDSGQEMLNNPRIKEAYLGI